MASRSELIGETSLAVLKYISQYYLSTENGTEQTSSDDTQMLSIKAQS